MALAVSGGCRSALLVGVDGALFFAFPGPDGPFSPRNHIGLIVDRAIFHYDYDPAYSTLNFIPSTVWTLTGRVGWRMLMSSKAHGSNSKS